MMGGHTHASLVMAAAIWLRGSRRCKAVLTEIASCYDEIPDVIGWLGGGSSIVVEVKISREDFLRDARKPFRRHPERGMGIYRYFFVPRGLLQPGDVPRNFGLAELRGERVFILRKPVPFAEYNWRNEMHLLVSAVDRVTRGYGLKAFGPLQPDRVVTDTPRAPGAEQLALPNGEPR